jgi:transcriptional regulator with XRE-family HTH domain
VAAEFLPLIGRFNLWLRRYREGQDLTRKELADQVGCSVETIENYEQGRTLPSKTTAARMARVIGYPEVDAFVLFARQGRTDDREFQPPDAAPEHGAAKPGRGANRDYEQWPVAIREQFKNNHNRWGLGFKDDGTGLIVRSLQEGVYCLMLTPRHDNGCFLGGDSAIIAPKRFYLTVEIEKIEGPDNSMAGIYFEELHDSHQIVFHARYGEREFAVASLQDGGNQVIRIIPWQERADLIRPDRNQFGLLADQEQFTFFINGTDVGQATIPRVAGARLDVGIGGVKKHERIVFFYRDFMLRVPPQQPKPPVSG